MSRNANHFIPVSLEVTIAATGDGLDGFLFRTVLMHTELRWKSIGYAREGVSLVISQTDELLLV